MISMIYRLPVGNALRIILTPPSGAEAIKLCRNGTGVFLSHDAPNNNVVYNGLPCTSILDWFGILNEEIYHYCLFSLVEGVWIPSDIKAASPIADDVDLSVDVLSIVRERLELGLLSEVTNGILKHKIGRAPVLTAPPLFEHASWPIVTVHVASDASSVRGVGEQPFQDEFDPDDWSWSFTDGWLSQWSLAVVGWSLNPDERILLRKALKRVVIGNLPVFDDAGMLQIDFQQQDVEDFESYNAPVYETVGTLTCLAPSVAGAVDPAIVDVEVEATTTW